MPALPDRSGQSRPFNFALAFAVPAIVMLALLIGDPTQLDFAVSRLFYEPGVGFVGRHSWLLEDFLHDRVKQAVIAIGVLAIAGFLLSLLPTRLARWRRPLGYLVLALGISTSIVTPLKTLTGVHCPWSLTDFGGSETFTAGRTRADAQARALLARWPCLGGLLAAGAVLRFA